jgi:hypothetical protein
MVANSIYFSEFEFKLLHKIKSKTPSKQFPKITSIKPGVSEIRRTRKKTISAFKVDLGFDRD